MDFEFLNLPYQSEMWLALVRYLFGDTFKAALTPMPVASENERVDTFVQHGVVQLNDTMRTRINVYALELKPGLTKVHRNRVMLATIVEKIRSDAAAAGALAVFADPGSGKWRLTLVAKRDSYTASGALSTQQTEPKRFTYLLGKDENTRTARQRFEQLAGIGSKRLEDVLEAFSVEKINKEFFDQYKKHYEECWQFLAKPDSVAYTTFKINPQLTDDKARKPLRDFAKRLMGRIVFLYFLQKKGWMGCAANVADWQQGDPNFIANLFNNLQATGKNHFYSQQLTRLFFKTLNERRANDFFEMPDGSQVRIPYLNGGLFDGDVPGTEQFDLPADWFERLFEFFGKYNFTIDESAPNDHEIGIDPEMLGHIFENLLEENREKGAYYTPKEIVHYMCQESLLLYLKERLGLHTASGVGSDLGVVWSDSRQADEAELENFVRNKKRGEKHNFVYKNARAFEKLLKEVRICDPAIGSGAFPMGLLYEIFHCQMELDLTEHPGDLKKNIIHHCIYGVDKDKGAVDIARLRFWLALVVDEEAPQPLPNFDYKIMQGDSLLESFEGIDLSNLLGENGNAHPSNGNGKKKGGYNNPPELFATSVEEPAVQFGEKDKAKLSKWINRFFEPKNGEEKAELQVKINNLINNELNEAIRRYKMNLFTELGNQKTALAREQELRRPGTKHQKEIARLEIEIAACETKQEQLAWWQEREEKPYFLWHTWFRDVFDKGGFDIVIGNPPYVRQEGIGSALKSVLQELYPLTFKGTADLLVYFIELSYNKLLRQGGQFAFIVNNKWIRSGYGEGLRKLLQENTHIHQLIDFGDLPVFESAMAYPCILMFEKNPPAPTFEVVLFEEVPFRNGKKMLDEVGKMRFTVKTADLNPEQWHLHLPVEEHLLELVNKQAISLDKYIGGEAYYGIKTGASSIFMLSDEAYDRISKSEYEIIKPTLMGRDLKKYDTPLAERNLLFVRRGINIEQYPISLAYLSKFREQLEPKPKNWKGTNWPGRKEGTYKWYEIQDAVDYWQLFEQPKIMYQKFQVTPCFILDYKGLYCNDSMWIIPRDDKYLLGYLNSQLGWWCITMYCSRISGGYQLMYEYLKNIPVPQLNHQVRDNIVLLVNHIIAGKQQERDTSLQEAQIDALFFHYCGIHETQLLFILSKAPFLDIPFKNVIQQQYRDLERNTFQLAI